MGTKLICSATAAACVVAGCGGSSSGGAESTTPPTSTVPTTTSKPAPTKQQIASNELWKFLGRVRGPRARSNRFQFAADAADQHVAA